MTLVDCLDPSLGERVLEGARRGGFLAVELRHHVESCASCRTDLERVRRIVQIWSELEPSPAEIAAAHVRFTRMSAPPSRIRAFPGVLAFPVLLAGAVAFAGARVVGFRAAVRNAIVAPPAPSEIVPWSHRSTTLAMEPPRACPEPMPPVASSAPTVVLPPPNPWRTSPVPVSPVRASPQSAAVPLGWADAARAMRARDYSAAERAFDDLARSDDGRARDAARLARAQVWVTQGRTSEARSELESLAASGTTELVRDKAAALLRSAP